VDREHSVKLTEWTSCGGCAAKWGGGPLRDLIHTLASDDQPDLLVGLGAFDDAAVYRIDDDTALVSTTDFFPPLVDEPADFGAIAAANACSDIFAMGARVLLALNISALPEELPPSVVAEILSAAAEVVRDAGGVVAGGHTIRASEPIFGLAVQGLVHPDRIWTKGGSQPGNRLVLSKPVGTGIALAGHDQPAKEAAIQGMKTLNQAAASTLADLAARRPGSVRAVTDVTGFGLAGHSWEMAERASVRLAIESGSIPLYPGVRALAESGVKTGGESRNRAYLGAALSFRNGSTCEAIVLDPQTSGGLLAAVDPTVSRSLAQNGWYEIGEVDAGAPQVEIF
jgi:selenide, water dikinase